MRHVVLPLALGLALACSPKKGGGGASSATVDDAGSGTETKTDANRPVVVEGEVKVPDDDLTILLPEATSLALLDGEPVGEEGAVAVEFTIRCETVNLPKRTCEGPVTAKSARRGTFSFECPDFGDSSVACYMTRGERIDSILIDGAPLMNVKAGKIVATLVTRTDGMVRAKTDDALTTAKLENPTSSGGETLPSFTGSWTSKCTNEALCGGSGGDFYFVDFRDYGRGDRVLALRDKASAKACIDGDGRSVAPTLKVDGRTIAFDLSGQAAFEAGLEEFFTELPKSARDRLWASATADTWSFERHCGTEAGARLDCTKTQSKGAFAGLYSGQARALYSALDRVRSDLDWIRLEGDETFCQDTRTVAKVRACLADPSGAFCISEPLFLKWDEAHERFRKPEASATVKQCASFVHDPLAEDFDSVCWSLLLNIPELGVRISEAGRLEIDPDVSEISANPVLCPDPAASADECRTEFLAAPEAEQLARAVSMLYSYDPRLCPDVPVPGANFFAGQEACRDAFLAAPLDEQLARTAAFDPGPDLEGALCAVPDGWQTLATANATTCLHDFYYSPQGPSPIACDTKTTADNLCLDGEGRYSGAFFGQVGNFRMSLGVDRAFGLLEDTVFESVRYDSPEPDAEPVPCTIRTQWAFAAARTDADTIDGRTQRIEVDDCFGNSQVDQALPMRFSRTGE